MGINIICCIYIREEFDNFQIIMEGGDRDFSFYRKPGADMMLTEAELNIDMLKNCRIFHFGSLSMTDETCRKATKKAIVLAKENGAVISFDPNLREPLWESLDVAREQIAYGMEQCDILKISDNEIQWFTGEQDYKRNADICQCSGIAYYYQEGSASSDAGKA